MALGLALSLGVPFLAIGAGCSLLVDTSGLDTQGPLPDSSFTDTGIRPPDSAANSMDSEVSDEAATGDHDSPIDGGNGDAYGDAPTLGFCASFTSPDGSTFACEDFDENADASAFGTFSAPGGIQIEDMIAKSLPYAMEVDPLDGGGGNVLLRSLAAPASFTFECDVMIVNFPASSQEDELITLASYNNSNAQSSDVFAYVSPAADGGVGAVGVFEFVPLASGGQTALYHPAIPLNPSPTGWIHFEFAINIVPSGGYADSLYVNGSLVEFNYPLASTFFEVATNTNGGFGQNYATGPTVYFDNLVVISD